MTMKNTESLANSSNEFYCPNSPEYIWDLHHTTSFKIIVAITTIACLVIILLNLLVIIAVKTRRELEKNSNILLSGVALTDLLVGVVSMPLSITLDTLVIKRVLVVDIIRMIDLISVSVPHIGCRASFFHLILIAWERYVAIAKWMECKAIVTRGRLNECRRVAWLLALLIVVPVVIMGAASVPYELILVVDIILSIFWFVCLSLIAYFYVKVYFAVREWNRTRIRPVNVLVKGKLESKFAYTTF
ncbi:histamine H1 receptor-like [Orbicella faveolata]|uniref:histamine H1 receptor-like n=1 Tax=Orbicella faveolata TaxID=48498 RepID=UPI0009E53B00|nr:histamine H1 receptor-like [Orbicella faveolata]